MAKRKVEVFSAGCPVCDEAVEAVKAAACPSCEVEVRSMGEPKVAADAKRHGVRHLPAVVVEGQLAGCCRGGGIDIGELRRMGLGQA